MHICTIYPTPTLPNFFRLFRLVAVACRHPDGRGRETSGELYGTHHRMGGVGGLVEGGFTRPGPYVHPPDVLFRSILTSRSNWVSGFTSVYMLGTARGALWGGQGGDSPVWLGGVCILVRGVTLACSLNCQPDPQFRIPARLPFQQGNGEPSSADHP